jgi:hypothetical protein
MIARRRPTVVEVGPATIRALAGESGCRPDDAMVSAALDGIDDEVVLLGERPVTSADLWRTLIVSLLGRRGPVVVLHPSWWSTTRVNRVVGAATAPGRRVIAVSRSELIMGQHPTSGLLIEIAADIIALSRRSVLRVFGCTEIEAVADAAAELAESGEVLLDVAPGAAKGARAIREALSRRGLMTRDAHTADLAAETFAQPGRHLRRPIAVLLAAAAALTTLGGAVIARSPYDSRPAPDAPLPEAASASLLEGRIAVQIPPHWIVERITGGPGSRRVQVTSPTDADIALHITQSYAPETTLTQAAEVLGRLVADQPPGVFVEFRAIDDVAGRPAVTYREMRTERVIRWSVVRAGSTRISIGCQSAPGREEGIAQPCERAVASAREVGTAAAGTASNLLTP